MKARFAGFEDKVRRSFDAQSLMTTFGATLEGISPGRCRITSPIKSLALQQHGYAHAGLTFALGDSAAGYAALSMMDQEAEVLTAEIKINLLAPAKGIRLIADGKVLKPGRRLVVVQSEVWAEAEDGASRQVAALQGTMIPV